MTALAVSDDAATAHAGRATRETGVAVHIDGVSKTYGSGRDQLLAVDRVDISVRTGEFVCLVGASGCGKSTLLSMIAGLDKPTAGSISVAEGRPALMFQEPAALARALAQTTRVLLMDEPFAALDAITRDVLHEDLSRIHEQTGITIVFVTHNVREAVRLGDRVVMLSSRPGRVVAEWDVDIARPRRIESPDVGTMSVMITDHLRDEIGRHGRR